jgi:small subunit ribosomal protein S8
MTDPIADLLTRIRNAVKAGHEVVSIPRSRLKVEVVRILKDEGFLSDFALEGDAERGSIRVFPRYDESNSPVVRGLVRVSKPSRRVYVGKAEVPRVRNGLGVAILTTPRGVLTDRDARKVGVGGEVICYVW